MKKPMLEGLITAGMVAVVLLGGIRIQNKKQAYPIIEDPYIFTGDILSGYNINSGNNNTGSINTGIIDTGVIIEPQTDIQIFNSLPDKNKITVKYRVQPTEYKGLDYYGRTQLLVNHAKSDMQKINIPSGITGGYIFIKLRHSLPQGKSTLLYVNNNAGWFCGGGIKQLGFTYNSNEYLYRLNNVPLVASDCGDNRIYKLSGKTISIGGYVGTFDGNGIEEITIARY